MAWDDIVPETRALHRATILVTILVNSEVFRIDYLTE
jgi:hypothetical protein